MQQSLKSEKAIIIHSLTSVGLDALDGYNESEMYNNSAQGKTLTMTVHDIKETGHGPVMGAGRVMSDADKQDLKDYLNGEQEIRDCWLPRNLMMLNSTQMIWYVPSRTRRMYFKRGDKSESVEIMWPSLVFRFTASGSLYVAAYAGKGAPRLNSKLYHAPLWNIYHDSRLCVGTVDTTSIIDVEAMPIWEEAVYDTIFTHSNHRLVIKPKGKQKEVSDTAYLRFIRQKAKNNESIKASEMMPLGKTLQQWAKGRG